MVASYARGMLITRPVKGVLEDIIEPFGPLDWKVLPCFEARDTLGAFWIRKPYSVQFRKPLTSAKSFGLSIDLRKLIFALTERWP